MSNQLILRSLGLALLIALYSCNTSDDRSTTVSPAAPYEDVDGAIAVTGITITTSAAEFITSASATVSGTIVLSGKTIKSRGICYGTVTKPTTANGTVTNGNGAGTYACVLPNLNANTKYYARAYCTYGAGKVAYGTQVTFTTKQSYGTITDADGNEYHTITIGDQVWTVENLRTTTYRDGTPIPSETSGIDWSDLTTGAYCAYANDNDNVATYGLLYNWYAATDERNVAPEGWHVPSSADWYTLRDYLGGRSSTAGGYLKETGLAHWASPNEGATNNVMFTALPSGARYHAYNVDSSFYSNLGRGSPWWTTSSIVTNDANAAYIECTHNTTYFVRNFFLGGIGYNDKRTGYAIRLVKD